MISQYDIDTAANGEPYIDKDPHLHIAPSNGIEPGDIGELLLAMACPAAADCGRLVWGAYVDGGEAIRRSFDFKTVGTIGQWRAQFATLYALGVQDDTIVAATGAGTATQTVTVGDTEQLTIGAVLEWGVRRNDSQPFTVSVAAGGWQNASTRLRVNTPNVAGTPMTRSFRVRVCDGINGGLIYVPWAIRVNPSMELAQPTICVPVADSAGVGQATLTVNNIPAGLQASFGLDAQYITALGTAGAQFAARIGLYDGTPRRSRTCTLR